MNTKAIVCAIAALSMSISGVAFAQNDKDVRADRAGQVERGERPAVDRSQPRPATREQRTWERVNGGDREDRGRYDRGDRYNRGDRYDNRGRYNAGPPSHAPAYGYRDGRGAGPDHNFYRGGRLPSQWRSNQYVVDDWRGHRLSSPPRGYHWVQTGGDYVLVAIATGIIASILLSQ
ncbi:MAG: RcnB family protein [Pseudomonadota bacterium]